MTEHTDEEASPAILPYTLKEYAQEAELLHQVALVRRSECYWTLSYRPTGAPEVYLHASRQDALCHYGPTSQGLINKVPRSSWGRDPCVQPRSVEALCSDGLVLFNVANLCFELYLVEYSRFVPCISHDPNPLWHHILHFNPEARGLDPMLYARALQLDPRTAHTWWAAVSGIYEVLRMQGNTLAWCLQHTDPIATLTQWLSHIDCPLSPEEILRGSTLP